MEHDKTPMDNSWTDGVTHYELHAWNNMMLDFKHITINFAPPKYLVVCNVDAIFSYSMY